MKNIEFLKLSNGEISDFSPLKELPVLDSLILDEMNKLTDISFAKDMELGYFSVIDMPQITDEQKMDVIKFHDADISVGYTAIIGVTPNGLLTSRDRHIEIKDTAIANFENLSEYNESYCRIYGKKAGSTEYVLKYNDKEIYRGKINVSETVPTVLPIAEKQPIPEVIFSNYLKGVVILKDNNLYRLKNDSKELVSENVADYVKMYSYSDKKEYIYFETQLNTDGTITINGKPLVTDKDMKFKAIGSSNCCVSENGDVYVIYMKNNEYVLDLIYSGFGQFIEDSDDYFISDKNEVIYIDAQYENYKITGYKTFETGIKNITSSSGNYFIDDNNDLWYVSEYRNTPEANKRAENVKSVEVRYYTNSTSAESYDAYGNVHITSDGKAYIAGTTNEVELIPTEDENFRTNGMLSTFIPSDGAPVIKGIQTTGSSKMDDKLYFISHGNTLYLNYLYQKVAVADVDNVITIIYDDEKNAFIYFTKTDGSVWCYSSADKKFINIFADDAVKGDINGDGKFNISDAVLLQKWLLAVPDTKLKDPKMADICKDGSIDVFDLTVMKKMLLSTE
ncbi:MAG: hypothetical protein K6B38_08065 [Ruminococcus sp.]|nr:hypothetical protein [Ruminococcus sp.]